MAGGASDLLLAKILVSTETLKIASSAIWKLQMTSNRYTGTLKAIVQVVDLIRYNLAALL